MNTILGANWRTTLSGWITVLASLTGIDTVVFQPLKIDDLPTAVPKP